LRWIRCDQDTGFGAGAGSFGSQRSQDLILEIGSNLNRIMLQREVVKMKAVIMVNKKCNMRCSHCYIPYTGEMSPEDTLRTIKELREDGHSAVVAGSETLLNTDYLDCYEAAGQKHLLTNGLLLVDNPSLFERIAEAGITELRFSLDGFHIAAEGYLERLVEGSRKSGFSVQLTTVITADNYLNIQEFCDMASGYGADKIQFDRLVLSGRADGLYDKALDGRMVREVFSLVDDARKRFRKEQLEIGLHGNFGPKPGSRGERLAAENRYCPAGIDLIAITPDNKVYGCPFTMGAGKEIGEYVGGRIAVERSLLENRRGDCIAHLIGGYSAEQGEAKK
jgi:MoaA/NifB/PqqE/SkfB family radical SAM enzyme